MNNLKCTSCLFYYSCKTREPVTLSCGHTFCKPCLEAIFSENSIKCPSSSHLQVFTCRYSSFQEIPINRGLKKQLEILEVTCSNHPKIQAICIDFQSFKAYCEDCKFPYLPEIPLEELKAVLMSHLNDFNPSQIPPNYHQKIKKLREDPLIEITNRDLLSFLTDLSNITNSICCQHHESRKAAGFNFKSRELFCKECLLSARGTFKPIDSPSFKSELLSRILWLRRSNDRLDTLNEPYEQLLLNLEGNLKDTLLKYQKVPLNYFQAKPSLKSVLCSECKNDYTPENPPFIFHCVGGYTICKTCKERNTSIICGSCSNESIRHLTSETEEFFSFFNAVPLCSYCKAPYNLKNKTPKELPCKHVLCLECLNQHYQRANISRCSSCRTVIQNIKSLKSSFILTQQVLNNFIYCEKHKGKPAICIEKATLRPWCKDCTLKHRPCCETCDFKEFFQTFKLDESLQPVKELLESLFFENYEKNQDFRKNVQIEKFFQLSNQEMIDEIRAALEPQVKKKLRSNIPKGRTLFDLEQISESFVLRFFSLMPPVQKDPSHLFLCQPWKVDDSKNQIEALSFKANKNIKLFGVVLGKPLYKTEIRIDVFEVICGQVLSNQACRVVGFRESLRVMSPQGVVEVGNQVIFPEFLNGGNEDEVFKVVIKEPVDIGAEIAYSVAIKFRGDGLLFFRGNPFQMKDEVWGSDGTVFEFLKVHNESKDFIEGQHEINGPILGLIYQTK